MFNMAPMNTPLNQYLHSQATISRNNLREDISNLHAQVLAIQIELNNLKSSFKNICKVQKSMNDMLVQLQTRVEQERATQHFTAGNATKEVKKTVDFTPQHTGVTEQVSKSTEEFQKKPKKKFEKENKQSELASESEFDAETAESEYVSV